MGKKWKQWQILFSWVPKSLWMVTTAMKLKDTYSLLGRKASCCSVAQTCPTHCDPPALSVPHHLPKFAQVHVHCIGDASSHLILWCPLLLQPSVLPNISDFSSEAALHIRWPNYWSWSFSISPFNEYSGLIYLKTDWFNLLAIQGTFRSLLQHHSWKASILWHFAFFTVQLSQLYLTTGRTIALTIQTFVSRVMFLLFNMLCRN